MCSNSKKLYNLIPKWNPGAGGLEDSWQSIFIYHLFPTAVRSLRYLLRFVQWLASQMEHRIVKELAASQTWPLLCLNATKLQIAAKCKWKIMWVYRLKGGRRRRGGREVVGAQLWFSADLLLPGSLRWGQKIYLTGRRGLIWKKENSNGLKLISIWQSLEFNPGSCS